MSESKDSGPASDPEGSVKTAETRATEAEAAELQLSAPPKADEPTKNDGHDHDHADHHHDHDHDHDHGGHGAAHADDHGHGLAHTMPLPLLFGVLGALLALTVATVAV